MTTPPRDDGLPAPWRILGERRLIRTPVFDLKVRQAISPGHPDHGDFYVVDCPDWVNVIAVTPAHELVMIRQYRVGSGIVEWEIPGGLIDPDDADPVSAGVRELREETGYAGERARIIGTVSPNPALHTNLCHTVLVEAARPLHATEFDRHEDIQTVALPRDEVLRLLDAGRIRHALVVAALLFHLRQDQG